MYSLFKENSPRFDSFTSLNELLAIFLTHYIYKLHIDYYNFLKLLFYDDGTTEEYDKDYHKTYPSFLSISGNIYACYDGKFVGRTIDTSRLSFIGTGCFAEEKNLYQDEFGPIPFRNDVTVFSFDDIDDIAF